MYLGGLVLRIRMVFIRMGCEVCGFKVAELNICIDYGKLPRRFAFPACYREFLMPGENHLKHPAGQKASTARAGETLWLKVVEQGTSVEPGFSKALFNGANWQLWLDARERYIFIAPQETPSYRIAIERDFSCGEIYGDFSSAEGQKLFPLQNLGIRIFINWFANFGDMVVHASGAVINGKGYFFAGQSGAGKSTLISALVGKPGVTALGEDQVIIRFLRGQFWLFGTPWHTNPTLCSPLGAPLHSGFFLDRDKEEGITALTPVEGVVRLFQTAFIPFYRPAAVERILENCSLLAKQIPFYSLSYRLGTSVLDRILHPQ